MKKILVMCMALALVLSFGSFAMGEAEPVNVAIVVAGGLGDRSFYDSANEGLQSLIADYGVNGTVIECKEDASMYTTQLINAAETNDFVVAVGWQFWDGLVEIVPELPDTRFIFVDNGLDGVGDNLMSITYAQNEGSFLVGYIAAKLSETGKIGAVGGMDNETINDFLVGYEAGAKYADEAVEVHTIFAGDFEDPAKGKENALALYSMDCDIVFQVAGKTGEGVFEAAVETGNYAIGVDSDQKYINPDVIICSMIKQVGLSIYDTVAAYIDNGEFRGGEIWVADMATGFIDVGYGEEDMVQQVPDDLKAEVAELKEKIIAGEIEVPSAL